MDEQKTKEYSAFSAYYAEVVKRPGTAATRSLLNQLRTIAVGQFGNGAFQEILRAHKTQQSAEQTTERRLGKQAGGVTRRNSSPEVKLPTPGTARHDRLKERGLLPGVKSVAPAVVAGGETADAKFIGMIKEPGKVVAIEVLGKRQRKDVEIETVAPERTIFPDVSDLSAKEIVEKYGRDMIFEWLFNAGEDREGLEQKTDRQLANILKKKVSE